jgi:hypothetical protein
VPVGRDDPRHGRVAKDRLNPFEQVDHVVRAAAVEVVDADRDRPPDGPHQPVEPSPQRVHRVAGLPDEGVSALLRAPCHRTRQSVETADGRNDRGSRAGDDPDRIAGRELARPSEDPEDRGTDRNRRDLRLCKLGAPPEPAKAKA